MTYHHHETTSHSVLQHVPEWRPVVEGQNGCLGFQDHSADFEVDSKSYLQPAQTKYIVPERYKQLYR